MIAGLEETSSGQIIVDDRDATAEPPYKRGLSMVFQSYALYPHMSVRDNMGFSLKSAGLPKLQVTAKVDEVARVLKLMHFWTGARKICQGATPEGRYWSINRERTDRFFV